MSNPEYSKMYQLLHKDTLKNKAKRYREKHKEEIKIKKKKYYEENKEKILNHHQEYYTTRKSEFKARNVKNKYGISLEEYNDLLEKQKGLCAICGNPEKSTRGGIIKSLAVDHNHKTGKNRKLLCEACNTAIGKVNEDVSILTKMIEYLNQYK